MAAGSRSGVPAPCRGHLLGHGDAQPPARSQGAAHRPDRDRRDGGHAALGARDPDLPRLPLLRPPARRHPPPQRAAGPRERVYGVRERIDLFGTPAVPLYEEEARSALQALVAAGVEGVVVCFLFSYRNPVHEQRVRELAIFLSSELYPMRRDLPRLNSTLIEAYAAEPSREQLQRVRAATREAGAGFDLRIMAAHGGSISIDARELGRTLISGPIGGVVGALHLAESLYADRAERNIVCSDIGGTSFDVSLITDGELTIRQTPDIARFVLNLPELGLMRTKEPVRR